MPSCSISSSGCKNRRKIAIAVGASGNPLLLEDRLYSLEGPLRVHLELSVVGEDEQGPFVHIHDDNIAATLFVTIATDFTGGNTPFRHGSTDLNVRASLPFILTVGIDKLFCLYEVSLRAEEESRVLTAVDSSSNVRHTTVRRSSRSFCIKSRCSLLHVILF